MPRSLALKGKRVVITRKRSSDKTWESYLKKHGAIVKNFPTIKITPIPLSAKNKNIIKNLSAPDWIVFTSAEGVRSFKRAKNKLMPRVAAIGTTTALAARKAGYRVVFQPTIANGAALAKQLTSVKGRSIILLRASIASPESSAILTARGANVIDIPVYKTKIVRTHDKAFEAALIKGRVDYIIFASPSAVRGFFARVPKALHRKTLSIPVIAIGKSLSEPLKERGFNHVYIAKKPSIQGIVQAMI